MKPSYIQPRAGWFASSVFLFPSGSRIKNVKPHLVWVQPCEKENAGSKTRCYGTPIPLRFPWCQPLHWYCGLNQKPRPHCTVQEGTSWRRVFRHYSVGIHPGHSWVSPWFPNGDNWDQWGLVHQNSEPWSRSNWTPWCYSPDKTGSHVASELNTNLNAGMAQMFLGINRILQKFSSVFPINRELNVFNVLETI